MIFCDSNIRRCYLDESEEANATFNAFYLEVKNVSVLFDHWLASMNYNREKFHSPFDRRIQKSLHTSSEDFGKIVSVHLFPVVARVTLLRIFTLLYQCWQCCVKTIQSVPLLGPLWVVNRKTFRTYHYRLSRSRRRFTNWKVILLNSIM